MKNLLAFIMMCGAMAGLSSCLGNNVEDEYKDWREANDRWFATQKAATDADGKRYYTEVVPSWDESVSVLIHWYNDTTLTRDNLRPLYTSTVDIKYRGMIYDATPFDSSYLRTSPADSIYRVKLNRTDLIEGWAVGITRMHVGDSCRIVIPYTLGYGSYKMSSVIRPYSNLVFDLKLADIYAYETK